MNESMPTKGLARRRFLSLLGKSAVGIWILNAIPSGLTVLKPTKRGKVSPVRNKYAARVKEHPLAVKREIRG